jgi:D-alanyl-lipoteichoic acid acyltransferase DltB (MBOAT superfamily)
MIFTSINFLLFFPSLALLFYLTPIKWRSLLLLVASILFYLNMSPLYLLLLLGVGTSTYLFTNAIANTTNEKKKYTFLITNVILILLPLFFFKYFGAINNYCLTMLSQTGLHWPLPELKFLLPVGISFYTFVGIGYTIDVYNEEVEAEKDFGIVMLFISFFPLILSGPIERAANMLPQFKNLKPVNFDNITAGLKLMLWGYFMKLVVADRLGMYIDSVYNNIDNHNGSTLLLTTALYPFQVYTDLGGYSLIAIGTAKALGLDVMHNFKRPFFATSMADLWRRWHISLITWLTDYLYTPMAFYFRKHKMKGIIVALIFTFLISGIWHGAALTFIFWGLMQGFYLSMVVLTQKRRSAWEQKYNLSNNMFYLVACMMFTYILFSASQIFGRAPDLKTVFLVFRKIFSEPGNLFLDITTLLFALLGLSFVMLKDINDEFFNNKYSLFSSKIGVIRYSAYLTILFIIILFGVFTGSSFIYFQF